MGGLGNQMFQYAFGLKMALKNNSELKLDTNFYSTQRKRHFELGVFDIKIKRASNREIAKVKYGLGISHLINFENFLSFKNKLKPKSYISQSSVFSNPNLLNIAGDIYLDGHWQDERYFKDIENAVREEFTFKPLSDDNNKTMLEKIKKSNSVSVHVRRGDYINNLETKKVHGIDLSGYYLKAVEYINKKLPNPKYFVFSDDIDWCKKHVKYEGEMIFVDINEKESNYEDMRLMGCCKHNIVTNSSFSWWGAWLNNNKDKIVIAPKKWFSIKSPFERDIIPASWIKL